MRIGFRISSLVPSGLAVESVGDSTDSIILTVRSEAGTAKCPLCGAASRRIHSRYARQVADLRRAGKHIGLRVITRRFVCDVPRWRRRCRRSCRRSTPAPPALHAALSRSSACLSGWRSRARVDYCLHMRRWRPIVTREGFRHGELLGPVHVPVLARRIERMVRIGKRHHEEEWRVAAFRPWPSRKAAARSAMYRQYYRRTIWSSALGLHGATSIQTHKPITAGIDFTGNC